MVTQLMGHGTCPLTKEALNGVIYRIVGIGSQGRAPRVG